MKYEDYYSTLGVAHDASAAEIKKAYRNLARKFHPDVTTDPGGEEKFKKIAQAYQTLKDPEKRAAYDRLGRYQPGQEFQPPPDWTRQFAGTGFSLDDIDFSDLFSSIIGGRQSGAWKSNTVRAGRDYEVTASISLEDACRGSVLKLNLSIPERDSRDRPQSVARTLNVQIPKGTLDGQRLRLAGQGGPGMRGGGRGDLYVNIAIRPHPLFTLRHRDLYLALPLAPWEAALGAIVEVPTPGGPVKLTIPPGTRAGQKLRIAKRGLPAAATERNANAGGDLFAVIEIVLPTGLSERERALFKELASVSTFNPRSHFRQEMAR